VESALWKFVIVAAASAERVTESPSVHVAWYFLPSIRSHCDACVPGPFLLLVWEVSRIVWVEREVALLAVTRASGLIISFSPELHRG